MADHVSLGRRFSEQLNAFASLLESWKTEARQELIRTYRRIGQAGRAEAVKRVPVEDSRLKQSVITNTFEDSDRTLVTEVGTNVPYAPHLEFGTEHIAGGAVKALGTGDVTDEQAVKSWPAKDADAIGGNTEQMPWLRPAIAKILPWAIDQIDDACKPPEK